MITKNIEIIRNIPNIVSMSQADVDSYAIDDISKEQFYNSVVLFSGRAKNHYTYRYVKFHLDNQFKYIDIVNIKKYPLLTVYNLNTKKCLLNIAASLKSKVSNIDPRDMYTMVCYGHCCSCLSVSDIPLEYSDYFCDYFSLMFLKLFAKKYGVTGSYVDLIPQFKYIVSVYILIKFFNLKFEMADKKAKSFSKFDSKQLYKKVNLSNYNLGKLDMMLKLLSDSQVCPGIGMYRFTETVMRYYGIVNLAIFEDIMRFCSTLFCCNINSNSFFPQTFQLAYSKTLFEKLVQITEKYL